MIQSTLRFNITLPHVAAIMDAASLSGLPRLASACDELSVETLTVCTLPPDLRLAPVSDAVTMVNALVDALSGLDCRRVSLVGRRYYLPARVTEIVAASMPGRGGPEVRIAVDYACQASLLGGVEVRPAGLLLVPAGVELGNLLRWHFAGAARALLACPNFDAASLAALLDDLPSRQRRSRRSQTLSRTR